MNEGAPRQRSARMQATLFPHQVGGHTPCAHVVGTSMIAKPIDPTKHEARFYETLLCQELRPFVAAFYGTSVVDIGEAAANARSEKRALLDGQQQNHFVVMGGAAVHTDVDMAECKSDVNPWNLECLSRFETKYKQRFDDAAGPEGAEDAGGRAAGPAGTRCILLEDLTHRMAHPCILDVKLGTRMYPDGASEQKKRRAIAKSAGTTSAALGLRICGMQVYDPASRTMWCQDKYEGRKVTPATFDAALLQLFQCCGPDRAARVMAGFLARLRRLRGVIADLDGFRFYSSSLLLLFEGDAHRPPRVDVRMIDFAHTALATDPAEAATPDAGYLFGLDNLIASLAALRPHDAGAGPEPREPGSA